jgi:hypothetical protein
MNKKRTSLEALLRPPEAVSARLEAAPPQAARARRSVKQQTVYLPLPVYEQLRRLAFDERVKMHGLLIEGLDRVFKDRGLPGVPDLVAELAADEEGRGA